MGKATAGGIATALTASEVFADEKAESSINKPKNVLFLWGGWEGHDPGLCKDIFVPWLKQSGFDVVVSDTFDSYIDKELMNSLDFIVQIWTMGEISGEQSKGLIGAVKKGVGLAGWHGGLGDSFRTNTEYQFIVGGQWVSHPGGVIDYEVNIIDHEDPITSSIKDFKMHS